jgi:hypothetical protein
MTAEYTDADLARIAVSDAPILDSDTTDRIQFLLAPHLSRFATPTAAPVTDIAAPERRELPKVAA